MLRGYKKSIQKFTEIIKIINLRKNFSEAKIFIFIFIFYLFCISMHRIVDN